MYFVDLEELKIKKAFNYHTMQFPIEIDATDTIMQMAQKIKDSIPVFDKEVELEVFINVPLNISNSGGDLSLIDDVFTCATNLILAEIKNKLVKSSQGRVRERRLDVPENLKTLNADMSLVKRLINSATWLNRFNVEVDLVGEESSELVYAFELVPQHTEYENMTSVEVSPDEQ